MLQAKENITRERAHRIALQLASLKLSLATLLVLGAGVFCSLYTTVSTAWLLAPAFALFALNLTAAIATNSTFRRQTPLLVLHLALLALVLLVTLGRLSYLKGNLELSAGEEFAGALASHESGPLHRWKLDAVKFANEGFSVEYAEGLRRNDTINQIRVLGSDGTWQTEYIGDQIPLVQHGYRFYTTSNKGFSPQFLWKPEDSREALRGTVHLPSYPVMELDQSRAWTPPGSEQRLWIQLQFDETILDPEQASTFHLPSEHRLLVKFEEEKRTLQPGDELVLSDGTLTYEGLSTWMGYTVFSDWTTPWSFAAALLAALSLAWHCKTRFFASPWQVEQEEAERVAEENPRVPHAPHLPIALQVNDGS